MFKRIQTLVAGASQPAPSRYTLPVAVLAALLGTIDE